VNAVMVVEVLGVLASYALPMRLVLYFKYVSFIIRKKKERTSGRKEGKKRGEKETVAADDD